IGSNPFIECQRFSRGVWDDLQSSVSIEIPGTGGFDVSGFGDEVFLPFTVVSRVFLPDELAFKPASSDEVEVSGPVHVQGDRRKILVIFSIPLHLSDQEADFVCRALLPITTRDVCGMAI